MIIKLNTILVREWAAGRWEEGEQASLAEERFAGAWNWLPAFLVISCFKPAGTFELAYDFWNHHFSYFHYGAVRWLAGA